MTIYNARCPRRLSPLVTLGVAAIFALSLLYYEFELTIVVGESMLPTLRTGDVLLVNRRAYVDSLPRRGDVVVARYHKRLVVKRIVGLPGEEVEVKKGALFIDGSLEKENHPIRQGSLNIRKGKLLDGYFATLGDNRAVPAVLAIHPILLKSEIVGADLCQFERQLIPCAAHSFIKLNGAQLTFFKNDILLNRPLFISAYRELVQAVWLPHHSSTIALQSQSPDSPEAGVPTPRGLWRESVRR